MCSLTRPPGNQSVPAGIWTFIQSLPRKSEIQKSRAETGGLDLPFQLYTPQLSWWELQRVYHCCCGQPRFLRKGNQNTLSLYYLIMDSKLWIYFKKYIAEIQLPGFGIWLLFITQSSGMAYHCHHILYSTNALYQQLQLTIACGLSISA